MVFCCLSHSLDLIFVEPLPELLLFSDDMSGDHMVQLSPFAQSCVVKSGNDIDHLSVDVEMVGKIQAFGNDLLYVVALMSRVEMVVAGDDLRFYVLFQVHD